MNTKTWTDKYLPNKLSEIYGHQEQTTVLREFINNFKKGKALLIYGPSGGGKTSSVVALAKELDLELVEINASDSRNSKEIDSLIGTSVSQMSLFGNSKIILIDEVDGISGTKDRGAATSIAKIIEKSTFPIIMIANDPSDKKFKALRKKSNMLEFPSRSYKDLLEMLKLICKKENVDYEEDALSMLARRGGGDFRATINDLQTIAAVSKKITRKDLEDLGDRENKDKIINSLIKVFKTTDEKMALRAFDNINEDLDQIFLWVEENLPKEYDKPEDLARAMDFVSLADVFKGRIRRWQYYRFYVYCYNFLSAGVALAKEEKYRKMIDFKPTSRLLKIWMANMKNVKKKSIAEKIAEKTHTSSKRVMQDTIPYLKTLFQRNSIKANQMADYFELGKDEIAWMKK
jgi:replication factor C large subunit